MLNIQVTNAGHLRSGLGLEFGKGQDKLMFAVQQISFSYLIKGPWS